MQVQRTKITLIYCDPEYEGRNVLHKAISICETASCCNPNNSKVNFNPLNTGLNLICHLLALLGAHHIFHVSGLRVKRNLTLLLG